VSRPGERPRLDHAAAAAEHVLALVVAQDRTYEVTAEAHDRMVELMQAFARLLLLGRQR
jgi:hypothetical protein